jgi:CheY-like chemotaxis protein
MLRANGSHRTGGLELFATQPVDLVLLDYAMPEMNGGEVAATMKRIKRDVRIIFFSGASIPESDPANIDAVVENGQHPAVVLKEIEQLLREPNV